MALISERAATAANPDFVRRVRQAAVEAAIAIANEDQATPYHDQRSRFAEAVLRDPDAWAIRLAVGVAGNPNVGTGSSDPSEDDADGDSALAYVVSSIWNAYAATLP